MNKITRDELQIARSTTKEDCQLFKLATIQKHRDYYPNDVIESIRDFYYVKYIDPFFMPNYTVVPKSLSEVLDLAAGCGIPIYSVIIRN